MLLAIFPRIVASHRHRWITLPPPNFMPRSLTESTHAPPLPLLPLLALLKPRHHYHCLRRWSPSRMLPYGCIFFIRPLAHPIIESSLPLFNCMPREPRQSHPVHPHHHLCYSGVHHSLTTMPSPLLLNPSLPDPSLLGPYRSPSPFIGTTTTTGGTITATFLITDRPKSPMVHDTQLWTTDNRCLWTSGYSINK